jgi:hypothetical protein
MKRVEPDRAKQKFNEALYTLIGPKSLRMRLTYAAYPLSTLNDKEIPPSMLEKFKDLRDALAATPLEYEWGRTRPREISPAKARELAEKIFRMYTELMGGL